MFHFMHLSFLKKKNMEVGTMSVLFTSVCPGLWKVFLKDLCNG